LDETNKSRKNKLSQTKNWQGNLKDKFSRGEERLFSIWEHMHRCMGTHIRTHKRSFLY